MQRKHIIKTQRRQDARVVTIWLYKHQYAFTMSYNPDPKEKYSSTITFESEHNTLLLAMVLEHYFYEWKDIQRTGIRGVEVNGIELK